MVPSSQMSRSQQRDSLFVVELASSHHLHDQVVHQAKQPREGNSNDPLLPALRKVSRTLLPLLFLVGMFNYLDRTNLSFAALELNAELGFSSEAYGLGAGLFYLGYGTVMIPSTFMTMRYGARCWYGAITIMWGIVATCSALIRSHASFYVIRFLLGATEAGSASSAWHLLCQFYPEERLTKPYAVLCLSAVCSTVFAAPLAAGLMSLRGVGGLAGWQWLFIIEGLPTIILGLAMWVWLPSQPLGAWVLTPEDQELLHSSVHCGPGAAEAARQPVQWSQLLVLIWDAVKMPMLWFFIAVGFLWVLSVWSLSAFMPIIIKNMLSGTALSGSTSSGGASSSSTTKATLLTAIPYICAAAATWLVAWHADRVHERTLHIAVPYIIGGVVLACFTPLARASFQAGFAVLVVAMTCAYGGQSTMITKVACYLPPKEAGVGLSIFNAVCASIGGFVGPIIVGSLVTQLGTFSQATVVMGAFMGTAGLLTFTLGMYEQWQLRLGRGRSEAGDSSNCGIKTQCAAAESFAVSCGDGACPGNRQLSAGIIGRGPRFC